MDVLRNMREDGALFIRSKKRPHEINLVANNQQKIPFKAEFMKTSDKASEVVNFAGAVCENSDGINLWSRK